MLGAKTCIIHSIYSGLSWHLDW